MQLHTSRLTLELQSREEVEAMIAAMPAHDRAQVSPQWLDRLRASNGTDPWVQAFKILLRDTNTVVGTCAFKGPPADGVVEIAYGIEATHEGNGYATEAATALVTFACSIDEVRVVRAHTLTDGAASKRVLIKSGFRYVGDVVDPEDGLVSRFEVVCGRKS
jgi:ribosomal-protein-alanine N-acetyltransferase